MMEGINQLALKVHDDDNVASIFMVVDAGTTVEVLDRKGNKESVTVLDGIPYGHKLATTDIKKGDKIIKYGEAIGIATKGIKKGNYVHVHNLDSARARGDLQ